MLIMYGTFMLVPALNPIAVAFKKLLRFNLLAFIVI